MDWTTIGAVLGLAALSGITTLIGVTLAVYTGRNDGGMAFGVGFSVGIMVLITIFEVGPLAAAQAGLINSIGAIAIGIAVFALIAYTVSHTSSIVTRGTWDRRLRTAYLVTLGIVMHNFPEGMALADSFIAAPTVGLFVTLAIALHNIPEEFAMAAPLVGLRRRRFLYSAATISALAEPTGAVLGLATATVAPTLNPLLLAFAGGAMIFVAIHELLPLAGSYKRPAWVVNGLLASLVVHTFLRVLFAK